MPVYQIKNISESIKVGVWKIEESENALRELVSDKVLGKSIAPQTNNEIKLKQWLATRCLLSSFFKDAEIVYDSFGKPSLDNGWFISISHSNEYVTIIVNKKNDCGIDIEKVSSKVERIKHKFLSENDLKVVKTKEELTLYWGAKEALYKCYGKKEVLFIENLFIEGYCLGSKLFNGRIDMPNFKKEIPMRWDKIDDYVLVFTL